MRFDIQIPDLRGAIERLGRPLTEQVLNAPLKRAQAKLISLLGVYPSPPPNSKYQRTGDLGRAWAATAPQALSASIQNNVRSRRRGNRPYAGWVQSARQQASIHQGRWTTDEQAMQRAMPDIERDFTQAINNAL